MKRVLQEALPSIIAGVKPRRFAAWASDSKGNLLRLCAPALAKASRWATYETPETLPPALVREIGKAHPGLVIRDCVRALEGADLAFADTPERLAACWHASAVVALAPLPPSPSFAHTRAKDGSPLPVHQVPGEPALWSFPALKLPPPKFEVRTRNCVDDRVIRENLLSSLFLGLPSLQRCGAHGLPALMCSGGPSLVNHLDEIRAEEARGGRIVCVKHSHDVLLAAGIVPWACILLDPRGHVRDFIPEPDARVRYFVSSTCHASTFDRLLASGAEVWLYHPLVGAGEDALVQLYYRTAETERARSADLAAKLGLPNEHRHLADRFVPSQMIAGGTTSASRGIMVMHMLGFRTFVLFGFDSCFWERKDLSETKPDGQPRWHELSLGAKTFHTDAELYAQVQDFQWMTKTLPDVTWDARGEGMVPEVVRGAAAPSRPLHTLFPEFALAPEADA